MEPIPAIARHEAINRDEPIVHDVGYCGPGTFEQFPTFDAN